jgi:hypothetical protein
MTIPAEKEYFFAKKETADVGMIPAETASPCPSFIPWNKACSSHSPDSRVSRPMITRGFKSPSLRREISAFPKAYTEE